MNAPPRHWLRLPRASTVLAVVVGCYGLLLLFMGFLLLVVPGIELRTGGEAVASRQDAAAGGTADSGAQVIGILFSFFGVLLMLLGRGLLQRRRRAWGAALALAAATLPSTLFRVVHGESILTNVPTLLVIVGLLAFHRQFSVRAARRFSYGQVVAGIAIALALVYGVVGTYLMREQFHGVDNWADAAYFALVAYVTLGYDFDVAEIYPNTTNTRWFAVSMYLIGMTLFITALTVALGPIVEGRVKGVMYLVKRFQQLRNHVVVCGYSGVAASVIDEMRDRGVVVVIVDDREKVAQQLRDKGHEVLEGDPTLRETLIDASAGNARALIATFDSDSMNTLVAVNAKDLRDSLPRARFAILVRIEDEENVEKVHRLGVDEVISPSTLGGRLLAEHAVALTESRRTQTPANA